MEIFSFAVWERASECVCVLIIQLRDIKSESFESVFSENEMTYKMGSVM
jgi:hypothetical protein